MTLPEAAALLRVNPETLRRALVAGTAQGVTGYRVGRLWRVTIWGDAEDGGHRRPVLSGAPEPRPHRAAVGGNDADAALAVSLAVAP